MHDQSGAFTPIGAAIKGEMTELTTRIAERMTRMLERRALDDDIEDVLAEMLEPLAVVRAHHGRALQIESRPREP